MVKYRTLHAEEICRELFKDFIRHQIVEKCWRRENGTWEIKDAPFVDDWTEQDYQVLISCLKHTVLSGGFVYAAFYDGKLKGFVSVESELSDDEHRYCDLSSIHVSEDMRNRGIGKSLSGGEGMGQEKRRQEALHIGPLSRREPGVLSVNGLHGGRGL